VDEYSTYHYREEKELGVDEDLKEKDTLPVDQANHGQDCDSYLSVMLEPLEAEKITPKASEAVASDGYCEENCYAETA
jgi:hypothetical protein